MQEVIKNKISIGWTGPINSKKYGGVVYGDRVREILSENFDLEFIDIEGKIFNNKYLKLLESLFALSRLKGEKSLWMRDFFSVVTMSLDKTEGKNLVIIHHVGFYTFPLYLRIPYYILEKIYYHNLRKVDAIVTVSEYWRKHFIDRGYKNVYKIYNSFDLLEFNISDKEVSDFKNKYNLQDKPIIYLGNCQKAKGVVESYEALKDLDVHLVTSGPQKVKIPAINLNLEYREYLTLLKASSLVLAMSRFKEGWCRTPHEAMLLKTPVIGSGFGGMGELLEKGKQIICEDFKNLKKEVENVLIKSDVRKEMRDNGYNYVKQFTTEKFKEDWVNLIKKII